MRSRLTAFPPVAAPDAVTLILGSMPGEESLRKSQYYAHPSNAFWPILGILLGFDSKALYAERLKRISDARLALWDVLESCVRPGSMDSDIRNAKPNSFKDFFEAHRFVRRVVFNGATAERLFFKGPSAFVPKGSVLMRAPSTSPAYASLGFEAKLKAWSEALQIQP